MTEPNQQLVEALRNRLCVSQDLEDAAADEIERLAAIQATDGECQKLRSALQAVKERCFKASGDENWAHDILSIVVPATEDK
jgi:hypothetical protein